MQLVTVGTKYQIVIPKNIRRKIKGITPGSKVGIQAQKNQVVVKPTDNWVERTSGAMKQAWTS